MYFKIIVYVRTFYSLNIFYKYFYINSINRKIFKENDIKTLKSNLNIFT